MRAVLIGLTATAMLLAAGCAVSETKQPTQPLTVDVTISHGNVTPTNAELKATVGQQIVVNVTSDAPDELHVHSVPDHLFPVEARGGQTFQFSIDIPGRVDVELHHPHRTVATILVEP